MGVTNPSFNPVCLGPNGAPLGLPGVTDPSRVQLDQSFIHRKPEICSPGCSPTT